MASGSIEAYDIHLSRVPLVFTFLAGLLFLVVGLDLGAMHAIFPYFSVEPDKIIILNFFIIVAVISGGALAVISLMYLLKPPVMLRASSEGISFGTGFRYALHTIPWSRVEDILHPAPAAHQTSGRQALDGLAIRTKGPEDMPHGRAASVGVLYARNMLSLSRFFMGNPAAEAREKIIKIKNKYGG